MTRCLILNCSKAKIKTSKKIRAVDIYDGPAFRVIHSFFKRRPEEQPNLDIYILSAKHGLISGDTLIAAYDETMTPQRANQLKPQVLARFRKISTSHYSEVLVLMSKNYLGAMQGYEDCITPSDNWTLVTVSEGRRLRVLKAWLYKEDLGAAPERTFRVTGRSILKGRIIEMSPEDIIALASKRLKEHKGTPFIIREWYATINNSRVSPKWLVSLLTGLKASEYDASDARRVLALLGIPIKHV
jgi:hypothetical protein